MMTQKVSTALDLTADSSGGDMVVTSSAVEMLLKRKCSSALSEVERLNMTKK
jgi:hypothetical protein